MESTKKNGVGGEDRQTRACMLTIAGLDPSGGAGIAADLRAAHAAQVWGCAVCAVITVQSTAGLVSATAVESGLVRAQAEEVLANERVLAIKTGALGSTENVEVATEILKKFAGTSVVDPVMIATRSENGARLLDGQALAAMRRLISVATVVTPNVMRRKRCLMGGLRVKTIWKGRRGCWFGWGQGRPW